MAAGGLARPHIANAAAKTATVWVYQGFIPEEDAAFRKLVTDYQKASGNMIDYSILPFTAMLPKTNAAITSGVVPDAIEAGLPGIAALNAWKDKLLDVTDIVETQKSKFSATALLIGFPYDPIAKKRSYYAVPWKMWVTPVHVWRSLVEKAGHKTSEIPKTWDAFVPAGAGQIARARDAQGLRLWLYREHRRVRHRQPV